MGQEGRSSKRMASVGTTDTRPELRLRKVLWRRGLRYRVNVVGLPGRPDIVFPSAKVAVFVDGDFWHGKILREKGLAALARTFKAPQLGVSWWVSKIQRNVQRDDEVRTKLEEAGWTVLRIWESDILAAANLVADFIEARVRPRS